MNTQLITTAFGNTALRAKKNSPHIFFAAGLAGVVTSAVLACRATLKLEKELDQIKLDLDTVRQNKEIVTETDGAYSQSDYARDLSTVYFKSSMKVVRMYAPAIIIGSASIAALSGSHIQMARRNAALSSTVALLGQAFNDYRDRVREVVGEDKELELYRNMTPCELDIDGKTVKTLAKNPDSPFGHSSFAVCFDERSSHWQKNVEMNRIILNSIQFQMNNKLRAYGHVFLNDVYDELDLPKSDQGQIFGWMKNSDTGDGNIEFVMYDAFNTPDSRQPYDKSIWLDFNVDAVPLYGQFG